MKKRTKELINHEMSPEQEVLIFHNLSSRQHKVVKKYAEYILFMRLSDGKEFSLRR